MPRQEKIEKINNLKEKLRDAKAIILTDFRSLTVKELTMLRKRLRQNGVEYKVIKNTLAKIAAKEIGMEELIPHIKGPVALALETEDVTSAAKVLTEFSNDVKNLQIEAGILDGKIISFEDVKKLAEIPPRNVLLSNLTSCMQAPIHNLVWMLSAIIRNLLIVLKEIKNKKH